MPWNALMDDADAQQSAVNPLFLANGNGSHWYPDTKRIWPVPQYIPDSMFTDNIRVMPPNETARQGLGFDRMDPYERGQGMWAPRPFPTDEITENHQ